MNHRSIPQLFTKGIVKLLHKCQHSGDLMSNFRSLTMLNTDLKILENIWAYCLHLPSLIGPEKCYAVERRTIQEILHLVCTIIEKVDGNALLINLDQSKVFDRDEHGFLEAILFAVGFGENFYSWIRLLYAFLEFMVEVNVINSKRFILS